MVVSVLPLPAASPLWRMADSLLSVSGLSMKYYCESNLGLQGCETLGGEILISRKFPSPLKGQFLKIFDPVLL